MKCLKTTGLILLVATSAIHAQQNDPHAALAQQKTALARLAFMDGVWRGPAYHIGENGVRHEIVQTERIGPLLDGTVKLIEGRGYNPDGSEGFNALAVLSFNTHKQAYNFRSYAMGNEGDFEFTPTADGFVWKVPAGPMTIRYTAKFSGNTFNEVGDRVMPDGKTVRFFEMNLKRVSDTTWPAEKPVPMK